MLGVTVLERSLGFAARRRKKKAHHGHAFENVCSNLNGDGREDDSNGSPRADVDRHAFERFPSTGRSE